MKDLRNCVFIAFMVQPNYDLYNLHNYIKLHFHDNIERPRVEEILRGLKKENTFICQDHVYSMTERGLYIINDHKHFFDINVNIIIRIFKKYRDRCVFRRTYGLKETRPEQSALRNHCMTNRPHTCIICYKQLHECHLETAHLKPRGMLNAMEMADKHVAELMCRLCHPLYDAGMLGVLSGVLCVSSEYSEGGYDVKYTAGTVIEAYSESNKQYFDYHYANIYIGSFSHKEKRLQPLCSS